jgi:hypothetical protein
MPQAPTLVPGSQVTPLESQQPLQLCPVHAQMPFGVHSWPVWQEPQLPPQPSEPHCASVQSGVQHCWSWQTWPEPQVAQRAPFVPQESALVPGRQTPSCPGPASQQPVGQLSPVQTHCPFRHTSPPWLQSTHCPPFMPQDSRVVPGRQVPPMQQPGQFCGVQQGAAQKLFPVWQSEPDGAASTQTEPGANPWHSRSVAQANPEASWVPLQKGWPARETRQTHSGPSPPSATKQVVFSPGSVQKFWPMQVQLGEQVAHCPSWQSSALLQGSQATPPVPQFWSVFPGTQRPFRSQQPFAQVCALQPHRPSSEHGWPPGHVPQPLALPQLSGPQLRPAQLGTQQSPCELHVVAPAAQHSPSQHCRRAPPAHAPSGSGPSATTV